MALMVFDNDNGLLEAIARRVSTRRRVAASGGRYQRVATSAISRIATWLHLGNQTLGSERLHRELVQYPLATLLPYLCLGVWMLRGLMD